MRGGQSYGVTNGRQSVGFVEILSPGSHTSGKPNSGIGFRGRCSRGILCGPPLSFHSGECPGQTIVLNALHPIPQNESGDLINGSRFIFPGARFTPRHGRQFENSRSKFATFPSSLSLVSVALSSSTNYSSSSAILADSESQVLFNPSSSQLSSVSSLVPLTYPTNSSDINDPAINKTHQFNQLHHSLCRAHPLDPVNLVFE